MRVHSGTWLHTAFAHRFNWNKKKPWHYYWILILPYFQFTYRILRTEHFSAHTYVKWLKRKKRRGWGENIDTYMAHKKKRRQRSNAHFLWRSKKSFWCHTPPTQRRGRKKSSASSCCLNGLHAGALEPFFRLGTNVGSK